MLLETLAVAACAHCATFDPPKDGKDVLARMHAAYAGKWYRTLTFVQKTSYPDGRVEIWHEALSFPGLLRIDVEPVDSGKTILFRADSIYEYENRAVKSSAPMVHPLMVLGFDVYFQPTEEIARKLTGLNFDLTKVREDRWQGRPVWVVGAIADSALSREFWVDQERLVFVRMVQAAPRRADQPTGKRNVAEILFNNYEKLGNGWVAPEVVFLNNGERVMLEEYSDMRADVPLDADLFAGGDWKRAGWIK